MVHLTTQFGEVYAEGLEATGKGAVLYGELLPILGFHESGSEVGHLLEITFGSAGLDSSTGFGRIRYPGRRGR